MSADNTPEVPKLGPVDLLIGDLKNLQKSIEEGKSKDDAEVSKTVESIARTNYVDYSELKEASEEKLNDLKNAIEGLQEGAVEAINAADKFRLEHLKLELKMVYEIKEYSYSTATKVYKTLEGKAAQVKEQVSDFFVPEQDGTTSGGTPSAAKQFFDGATSKIKGFFSGALSLFGFNKNKSSSVSGGFAIHSTLFAMNFIPFLGTLPGMTKKKKELEMRLDHIAATKKVEKLVSVENARRPAGKKIAVDLASFEMFAAAIPPDQFARVGALTLNAMRKKEFSGTKPIRWQDINEAYYNLAKAEIKQYESKESPSKTA